ncbi:MAG: hypothetical protein EPO21_17730 [Chloroflexota bacterium]|nr:MAG: hypothetical protein EPO21_17730 [Chloroflexota bacterium]
MDVELMAQTATETLIEDEALRGDLTDWEYQPLLDWAVARIAHCATQAADQEDPRAYLDACIDGVRQILRAVGEALADRDASPIADAVSSPAVDAADVGAVRARLAELTLSDDNEMNARQIVEALSGPSDRSVRSD